MEKSYKMKQRTFPLPNQSHNFFFAILLYYICNYIVQPNVEQMWRGTIYQEVATEETNDWHHGLRTPREAIW